MLEFFQAPVRGRGSAAGGTRSIAPRDAGVPAASRCIAALGRAPSGNEIAKNVVPDVPG